MQQFAQEIETINDPIVLQELWDISWVAQMRFETATGSTQLRISQILNSPLWTIEEKVANIISRLFSPNEVETKGGFFYPDFRGEINSLMLRNIIILYKLLSKDFLESFSLEQYVDMRKKHGDFWENEVGFLNRLIDFWFLTKSEKNSFSFTDNCLFIMRKYIKK